MKFIKQSIADVIVIEPNVHRDERGYLVETFREDLLSDFLGSPVHFVQDIESQSRLSVLRGLHYQLPPFAQAKLVRVVKGAIIDVVVDIRQNSDSFGQYVMLELSAENNRQLYIPAGFAHGYLVTEDETLIQYKTDNVYAPEYERGIRYDDKHLAIPWPLALVNALSISSKDQALTSWHNAELFVD